MSRTKRGRLVIWTGILLGVCAFGDVIVFKNGSRLEVKDLQFTDTAATYLVKQMTATVPIQYVDREATDAANAELKARREEEALKAREVPVERVQTGEIPLGNLSNRVLSDREIQEVLKKWAKRREESTLVRHGGASRNTPPQYIGDGNFEIPFRRQGNLMVVMATINDAIPAEFVFDTGASFVVISTELARRSHAEVDYSTPYQVETANGITHVYVGYLKKLLVGNMEVQNLSVMVATNCAINLLGQNLTAHFRVILDNKNNRIILEKN